MPEVLDTYSPAERLEILRCYRNLIEVWHTRKNITDRWMVRKAFRLAADAHKDMRRKTGEPYIYHPLEVATIAAGEIGLGRTSIICALLHDVVEDTEYKLTDISAMFGEHIARIIDGLTKIDTIVEGSDIESIQAENFRKVLLTLAFDVRVILIKLADRLHNMRTLDAMPSVKQLKIASETSYLFAPLAYRLGLYAIKSELEDLALKYTEPATYELIRQELEQERTDRNDMVEQFLVPIRDAIDKMDLQATISTVEKPISHIHEQMKESDLSFSELHDTFAVRFVVECPLEVEKMECWRIYAAITSFYRPNNQRLRDWISLPKANGYESLHATVMSKTGRWIDVQIRSVRMDEIAEKGYAAYWKYKDSPSAESGLDEWLTKVREIITSHDTSALEFVNNFKLNLFSDEIYVFTPTGEMISLPQGATALDFAFNLHTNLGAQCIGAKVNHKLVPLNYELHSGDQIEILTSKIQNPKEEWFDYLITARAKSRLKDAIREHRKSFKTQGREKVEAYFKQLNLEPSKANYQRLMEAEQISGLVDLYYFTAIDRINLQQIRQVFKEKSGQGLFKYIISPFTRQKTLEGIPVKNNDSTTETQIKADVLREDMIDLKYVTSNCCNPIPGDEVVALSFPNEPLYIHRVNCPKAIHLMSQYGNNIIKAKWKQKEDILFLAGIKIQGIDSVGFTHRITQIISMEMHLNMRNMQLESSGGIVNAYVTIYVNNIQQLKDVIAKLQKLEGVRTVSRLDRLSDVEV